MTTRRVYMYVLATASSDPVVWPRRTQIAHVTIDALQRATVRWQRSKERGASSLAASRAFGATVRADDVTESAGTRMPMRNRK